MSRWILLAIAVTACNKTEGAGGASAVEASASEVSTEASTEATDAVPTITPAALTPTEGAPQLGQMPSSSSGSPALSSEDMTRLYQSCFDRVEGRETPGECQSDADCVASGCSGEMCLSQKAAEGLMGTCEILPCFRVLDTCGCQDGLCRWTVGLRDGARVLQAPVTPGSQPQ